MMPRAVKQDPQQVASTVDTTAESSTETRKVVYKQVETRLCAGQEALTAKQARQLMGWEEEPEGVKFGDNYVAEIKPLFNRKIRCNYNVKNRPITRGNVLALAQEILQKHWHLNMENRIIGRTGLVLNGQHTFIALILAAERWRKDPEDYPQWTAEPTIETSLGFGIDESDEVVNTMDTCKARTLADVIYRSELFSNLPHKSRRVVARMADYAVRLLWHRTGACMNAFAPRRTHSESLDFIARHAKLLECVLHVYEENEENGIGRYLSPGYASGILYLMASSATDPIEYQRSNNPSQDLLDWGRWSDACDFFVHLAAGSEETVCLHKVLLKMLNDGQSSLAERCALLAKAWNCTVEQQPITVDSLKLRYERDKDDISTLAECPTVGGIDMGEPDQADSPVHSDPSPEEIVERARKVRDKRPTAPTKQPQPKPAGITASKPKSKRGRTGPMAGKIYWVTLDRGDPWRGRIVEINSALNTAKVKTEQGFQGAGSIHLVPLRCLTEMQPQVATT